MLLKHYLDQGVSKSELARRFGINRTTIHHWVKTGQLDRDLLAGPRGYSPRPPVAHKLDPYKAIVDARLEQFPKLSAKRLFDEVRAAGYQGCYKTLRQPNIDRLLQLGLSGMAEALEEQREIADVDQLGFDDRLALMIEREAEHRDHKSYLGHLRQAQLRIRADVQDVDCRAGRGIARTTLTQLAAGDWIRQGHNLILGGPTGSGKTFVACALAHQACRQHQSVLYRRVPELVAAVTRARDKRTLERLMGRLGRVSLLVLDDWGLQSFSAESRRDLLEIVEARHGRKSILIASRIP